MKKLKMSWFSRFSVKARLELLFVVVSIIPVFAIGYISISTFSSTMLDKGVQESLSRLEFIGYRTVEIMREKHYDALITAFNSDVRLYFDEDAGTQRENLLLIEDRVKREITSLYNGKEAASVALVGFDGSTLLYDSSQSSAVQKRKYVKQTPDLAEFRLFDRWCKPTYEGIEPVIPYERLVLGMDNQPVATLTISVRESVFKELYADYMASDDRRFYILNETGQILSASDNNNFGRNISETIGVTPEELAEGNQYIAKGDYTYVYVSNQERGLFFIEQIPDSLLKAGMHSILRSTFFVALLCLIVCSILGSLMARSFTQPLYRLIERVRTFDGQEATARNATNKNEIAILSDEYGKLIGRLETLIGEYYEEQRKKNEAEIRALEFQINPHFLYNTLSTIVWLIDADAKKDAIRITKDLASFFRISISKGREFIRIEEELTHVALYIDIQKARYADAIEYYTDVPDEILHYYTQKLILQPLIENSIIHAMQASTEKKCTISIHARFDGDDILFEVRDNGKAVSEETIANMNRFLQYRDEPKDKAYGIGISNVHDRVQMNFGDGYGLSFRRENGQTIATIRIKALKGGSYV